MAGRGGIVGNDGIELRRLGETVRRCGAEFCLGDQSHHFGRSIHHRSLDGSFVIARRGQAQVGMDPVDVQGARTGNAMIVDSYGRVLTETWVAADAMVTADLGLDLLPMGQLRRWMRVRRPELYHVLTEERTDTRPTRAARVADADARTR